MSVVGDFNGWEAARYPVTFFRGAVRTLLTVVVPVAFLTTFPTQALLEGLRGGAGVPYDAHDHQMYVHHLYSVIFSEVRRASEGRQNPFLNMPWTVPPLALRAVSEKAPVQK